jgi:hypothetical protein
MHDLDVINATDAVETTEVLRTYDNNIRDPATL